MGLGLKGGMGPGARKLLREAYSLKLLVFTNPCHEPDSGRFCETEGGEGEDDGFGVERQPKNRARLGKVAGVPGVGKEELDEIRDAREQIVTSDRLKFILFKDEVGPLRKQVNVQKEEVWLTRDEFMAKKGRYGNREMSAAERIAQPDLHGLVVVGSGGRYLDPFDSSHAVYRLAQTGMPKLINRIVPKVTGEEALSVELKPGKVGGSEGTRFKNRIYMIAGEKGGKKVALNVVIYPNGSVKTAFLERADGSYGDTKSVRKLLEGAGVKIPNKLIDVSEFGVERVRPRRRR